MAVHDTGDEHVSRHLAEHGTWEPFETTVVAHLLRAAHSHEAPLLVDCGANIGWYSLLAAALGADVVAAEPMPTNASLLRENIGRNGFGDRITVFEGALGEHPGRADLYLSATNQGDHRLHAEASWDPKRERPTISVEVRRLDELVGSRQPTVLKIDTQGSEVAILRGGRTCWDPSAGAPAVSIVTEFWPYGLERCGSSAAEFLGLLTPLLNNTHHCFEVVEWSRSLVPRTADELIALADSQGMSTTVRGFTNLAFIPHAVARAVEESIGALR